MKKSAAATHFKKIPLGDILVENGTITEAEKEKTLKLATLKQQRFGQILLNEGYVTESQLAQTLAQQFALDFVNIDELAPTPAALALVPEKVARQFEALPLSVEDNELSLAVHDPMNTILIDTIRQVTKHRIRVVVCAQTQLRVKIDKSYGPTGMSLVDIAQKLSDEIVKVRSPSQAPPLEIVSRSTSVVSIESLLSGIIEDGIAREASDIHIEPVDAGLRIRMRVHGSLEESALLPREVHPLLIARLKVLAEMDIAEKRNAQDGSFQFKLTSRKIDVRLSTLPTIQGEKAVMRLLDKSTLRLSLDELGMDDDIAKKVTQLTSRPYGLFLVTGPTGSGKTTTVYTLMKLLNLVDRNVVSIEDPIEYQIDGINQIPVNAKAGTTFSTALRSILRQDPDTIILGEIRDRETAEIAIRAALTGHLVISTLHTNDAASTLVRLTDMGVEGFLLASCLLGIVSQRLLREVCPHCHKRGTATDTELELLGEKWRDVEVTVIGEGCEKCKNLGFRGRKAIFECLDPTEDIRRAISTKRPEQEILDLLKSGGFVSMRDRGIQRAIDGLTTLNEVLKQTF